MADKQLTLGVIIGNRDFFPDVLITEGRKDILDVLAEADVRPIILDETATKLGAVETGRTPRNALISSTDTGAKSTAS